MASREEGEGVTIWDFAHEHPWLSAATAIAAMFLVPLFAEAFQQRMLMARIRLAELRHRKEAGDEE